MDLQIGGALVTDAEQMAERAIDDLTSIGDQAAALLDEERQAHQVTALELEAARNELAAMRATADLNDRLRSSIRAVSGGDMPDLTVIPEDVDPRDSLIDFPFADASTSDLLRWHKAEQLASRQEPDPVAARTHELRAFMFQRELAVRNCKATDAIDADHAARILMLEGQLAVAEDHRDTYRSRCQTLGREAARLSDLVETLRCGDLVLFADGELSEDRAASFREHLGRCEACQHGLKHDVEIDARLADLARSQPFRAGEQEPTIAPLTDDRIVEIECRLAIALDPSEQFDLDDWGYARGDVVRAVPELLVEIKRLKLTGGR